MRLPRADSQGIAALGGKSRREAGTGEKRMSAVVNRPVIRVDETTARDVADCFLAARNVTGPLVVAAYGQLQTQTDRQYAALTDPHGLYRLSVVRTSLASPYASDSELITSVRATRLLEVTTVSADRRHPLLGSEPGGPYERFRAVHDIVGHAATGYGFDQDGEYSAWLVQKRTYHGLARWAAATELHGENSALSITHHFPDHKAMLLDLELLQPPPLTGRAT